MLIQNHHESYISQEEFNEIQRMIESNAQTISPSGAAKNGRALLAGLIRCRRCGRKLQVNYGGKAHPNVHRYICVRVKLDLGGASCIGFSGVHVDAAVGREILDVVKPAAIEVARSASDDRLVVQDNLLNALRTQTQAARYEADRASRQFDAVDPANRLVADELERRWNVALERVGELEARVSAAERAHEARAAPDVAALAGLAFDLEQVWNAPKADARIKKRIARTAIEEVVADIDEATSSVVLVIHWKGGVHTELRVPKRSYGGSRKITPPDIVEAVGQLTRVADDEYIAQALSRAGSKTAQGHNWTQERVASLRNGQTTDAGAGRPRRAAGWHRAHRAG